VTAVMSGEQTNATTTTHTKTKQIFIRHEARGAHDLAGHQMLEVR
jgi:hypothetical protein